MNDNDRETTFRKNLIRVFEAAKKADPEALQQLANDITSDVDKERHILIDVAGDYLRTIFKKS